MMHHQAFLQSLSAQDRADLTTRSDRAGLLRLGQHFAVIVLLGILAMSPIGWLAILPLGIALVFLFCPLHEVSHDTVFGTKALNTWVARGLGLILFLPSQWFRYFHFAHHKHTHDPVHDPELATPKPETWPGYVWYLTGFPVWWSIAKTFARNASGQCDDAFVPPRKRDAIAQEARIMLGIYGALVCVSALAGSALLLWVWIIPMILGQPFLRLYLMAEHTLCPHSDDMFENTRTTFTTSVIRWLAWNMPYHAEHHAFPTVPFHKLPELHLRTAEYLRETSNGYVDFHASYQEQLVK